DTAGVLRAVVDRLAEQLPEHVHVAPDELTRTLRYTTSPHPPAPSTFLQRLQAVCAEQRAVRIRYYATSRDEETERDVEPYALLSHSGAWYLIAYCRMRKGMRDFRVDRMAALKPTGEFFARDQSF